MKLTLSARTNYKELNSTEENEEKRVLSDMLISMVS